MGSAEMNAQSTTSSNPALGAFLRVLVRRHTYTNLVYLALSFPLALTYAVLLFFSAVLGAVLSIIGVGVLMLLGCLVAAWGFAIFERELAIRLLGVGIPPMSLPEAEQRSEWRHLRDHLSRSVTWKSLAFLLLKLPFGLLATTAMFVLVGVPVTLIVAGSNVALSAGNIPSGQTFGGNLLILLGVVLLIASLHVVNWICRGWGGLAVVMLGISSEEQELLEARRRAEAADRSRRELILNVSHELRTPIASIRGHVDTLSMPPAQRPAGADQEHYLQVVSDEARRLEALVEDLLNLARADSHELKVVVGRVQLAPLVRGVVAAAAPMARRERSVTVAHAESLPELAALGDRDRLTQVLSQLVRNGVNNTPEGGAVYVQIGELPPGRVFIDVADTGHGIAPEDLERVFERFYRTDPSRSRDSGGFGLGLSIARELAVAMGGGITVTSEPGVGSTFRVTLRAA
jgi:two-component system phosphate regulon sensor histidine kinase PhoR